MPREGFNLRIDTSQVVALAERLHESLSDEQFDRLMYRTLNEASRKVRTETKRAVSADYVVTQSWVAAHLLATKLSGGGGHWTCIIPMSGKRGVIGGTFPASGGRADRRYKKRKVHLTMRAQILRGQTSTMPDKMDHQGGNPPFMAKGVGFTRTTKNRFPIARVVGLALPQMPINKSRPKVEAAMIKYMTERLEHNFTILFGK